MAVSCITGNRINAKADAVVVFMFQDEKSFTASKKALIVDVPHLHPLLESGDFTGKALSTSLGYVGTSAGSPRFILAGLGEYKDVKLETLRRAAAGAAKRAAAHGCTHIAFELPTLRKFSADEVAMAISEGAILSQYAFDKYITKKNGSKLADTFTLICTSDVVKLARKGAQLAEDVALGVIEARNLANAPNNEIYPETLAKRAVALGKEHGFKVTVLNKKEITDLKMGGLLAVNQGSVRPPVFIIMEHHGGPKSQKPIVLVGKGITFDTGGISIKPAAGMSDMKGDMHGSATVIGTITAAAKLGLKRNIIGIVPSTENMPSGTAFVPGDIVTFMNGKTAEIDNTDAEGRLILADALSYAERYEPEAVIDLATLTGACVVALGNVTTGMMGTDTKTMHRLKASGDRVHERVCELPLYEEYEELISSDVADIKNSGGRGAGTITAGLFLKHFVNYPWVHLDIAGTAMVNKASHYIPKGNTGVGVRLLIDALRNW
ncbi:MAG: leucyl aminopeptidase [Ignavibacteriae bacterium]|nr:MAG: leucyl aminopeptidase [Ignavibacteriota bacterium]